MSLKPFTLVGGIVVGESTASTTVILANGDITTNNITVANSANLGSNANVIITGGTAGYVLSTNGSGNLSWQNPALSVINNGSSNVRIVSSGGNVTTSVGGVANVFTVTTTGANVTGTFNSTGNLIAANANLGNAVRANYFIGNGSQLTNVPSTLNIAESNTTGGNISNAISNVSTLNFNKTTGIFVTDLGSGNALISLGSSFKTWEVTGQPSLVAVGEDTVQFIAGSGITITTSNTSTPKSITFVANNVANATYATTAGSATTAGTVTTNAQPNITSVGNLTGLTVSNTSGTVDLSNTANVTLGSVSNLHISGGTANYFLQTNGSGVLTWAPAAGSSSNISNGTSNVNIPTINGNVNLSAAGNANVLVVTGTGANITGTANVAGNLIVTDTVITGAGSGGNISGANVISANTGNFTANVTAGNLITTGANISGTANITGNVVLSGANVTLGAVGNLHISGGTSGYVLQTDGSGTLSWVAQTGGGGGGASISNGTSNVNIATSGGNITMSAAGNANIVVVTGTGANINGSANITGNVALGGANVSLGSVSNLHIAGGSNTYVLSTDGAGNLSWTTASGTSISVDNFTGNGVQTSFTLSTTPANVNCTIVSLAGLFQPRTVYSLAGNVITFSSAPKNTAPIEVTTFTAVTGGGSGGNSISNGNSNVSIATSNGNVTISAVGNANILTVTGTGVNVAGTLNVTGQSNLGAVGNVIITGGTSGQYLQTDGSGVLSWSTVISGSTSNISNGTSNVNIATSGGNITMSSAGNANIVVVTGTGANITGTLNVSGNANAGNIGATNGVFTNISGNGSSLSSITGANVSGQVTFAATANSVSGSNVSGAVGLATYATTANAVAGANVSGQVANSLIAGTVYTSAQPNITSVGTLTSLVSSGNITSNANIITDLIIGRTSGVTITAAGTNQNINLVPTGTGTVDVANTRITTLAEPTAATDAATKNYVDTTAQGLDPKASVVYATTAGLPTYTYNNGTSGVGATITATSNGALSIDGQAVSATQRVLVKNETSTNAPYNGIYVVTNAGSAGAAFILTRAADFNQAAEMSSAFVFVEDGPTNADTGWVCTTNSPITVGTTNITFTQFSGAGTYSAGTGLTLTGTVFSISNTTVTAGSYGNGDSVATYTVNSQGQLTAAANVAITANAANLSGTILKSTVVTSSLTSVGTLGNLGVSGNITAANITANTGVFTGNGSGLSAIAGANVTGTVANATYATSAGTATSATTAGTVTTNAQPNITSTGTLTSLNVSGNANVGNLGTAQVLATANITSPQLISNIATGTSPLVVTSTTLTPNLYVARANVSDYHAMTTVSTGNYYLMAASAITGNVQASGNSVFIANASNGAITATTFVGALSGAATTAGTVTTAAQPNITSVGTLTGITSTGAANFTGASNVSLGPVANVHISGGTSGYVLQTDGSGTLSWVAQSGGGGGGSNIANGNSNVSIATANGNITMSAVGNANIVIVTGTGVNVAGTLNVTGQSNLGAVGNVKITGGTANYVLKTDGTGNLSWVAQSGGGGITAQDLLSPFLLMGA